MTTLPLNYVLYFIVHTQKNKQCFILNFFLCFIEMKHFAEQKLLELEI